MFQNLYTHQIHMQISYYSSHKSLKGIIESRKSKKDKRIKNDLRNITQKTKIQHHLPSGAPEVILSFRLGSCCSIFSV